MRRTRNNLAFTLMELMVVISIIVLMLALSVPVVRSIQGSRSVETAYNRVAAALGHARQIALYYRAPAGIALFKDTSSGTLDIGYVMQQNLIPGQPSNLDNRYIEMIPNEEIISLPAGIGAQVFNGNGGTDKFFSEGVILFDEHGELASTPYWVKNGYGSNASVLARAMGMPSIPAPYDLSPSGSNSIFSHAAICLYDSDSYKGQIIPTATGGTFGDADNNANNPMNTIMYATSSPSNGNAPFSPPASSSAKTAEFLWLTTNGETLVIKPNDGSLLKNK